MPRPKNRRGFTLIELLLVVTVIGTLAALIMPRMLSVKSNAYRDVVKNDLKNLVQAQELLFAKESRIAGASSDSSLAYYSDDEVLVTIQQVFPDNSWWASAEHLSQSDSYCLIAIGETVPPGYVPNKIECTYP